MPDKALHQAALNLDQHPSDLQFYNQNSLLVPLAGSWEGSGNVAALDVLRAAMREPACVDAFFAEADLAAGGDRRVDAAVKELRDSITDPTEIESRARRIAERMALVLQASLLVRHGHPAVSDAFCASRLGGDWGHAYGTLPTGLDLGPIIERVTPKIA